MPNDINPVPKYRIENENGKTIAQSDDPLKRSDAPADKEVKHYAVHFRENGDFHAKQEVPFASEAGATGPPPSPKGKKPATEPK